MDNGETTLEHSCDIWPPVLLSPVVIRRVTQLLSVSTTLSVLTAASLSAAAPKDQEAQKLAEEAIFTDYLGTQFAGAEEKLLQAIELCDAEGACSPSVTAQLHRDLGVVYIAGMNQANEGKAEFVQALTADPSIQLDPDLSTPEVEAAWKEAQAMVGVEGGAVEEPVDTGEPVPGIDEGEEPEEAPAAPAEKKGSAADLDTTFVIEECPPDFPGCEDGEEADKGSEKPAKENWLTLSVQQDILLLSSAKQVCGEGSDYSCFQGDTYQVYGANVAQAGEVSGGFARGTLRILAGYDRVFGDNLTLGARLGFAIGGGPQAPGGNAFVPIHAEARVGYWFGSRPFADAGLRPYVTLQGGLAQIDAKVEVPVRDPAQGDITVDAWRKTGTAFVGGGAGAVYAFNEGNGILLEVRVMQMLGASATGGGAQLGYTLGF